ncbi:hypothetical protein TNCV_3148431 [Trichonephila clavipes]|nr:hypothetical protein TNCV_3148431 [Trichonephila clavipes]
MECHRELVGALGNNALLYRTVARWVGKFQQGCVSTSHEQRSGRPLSSRLLRELFWTVYECKGYLHLIFLCQRRVRSSRLRCIDDETSGLNRSDALNRLMDPPSVLLAHISRHGLL